MRHSAIQLARLSGFSPIITTASLKNAPLLQSFGATHVFDRVLSAGDLRAEVNKVAGGPVPVVYDAISLPETQIAAYGLLAPNGKLLTVLNEEVKEPSDGRSLVQVHGVIQFPHHHEFGKTLYEALPSLLESGDIKVSWNVADSKWYLTGSTNAASERGDRPWRSRWRYRRI